MKCKDTKSEVEALKRRISELEKRPIITFMGFLRFLIFAGSVGLAYANFQFIMWAWGWLQIPSDSGAYLPQHLLILGPAFFEYVIIAFASVAFCAWVKRGYGNLKSYDEEGLILGLIFGLIFGLILGLISGLIFGLIGLIFGLIGLIFGLIGLIGEFD